MAIGSGFPWWLDESRYLNSNEARALGTGEAVSLAEPLCPICRSRYATDRAHIWRGGMSGRDGMTIRICRDCHTGKDGIDRRGDRTLAIGRHEQTFMSWRGEVSRRPVCLVFQDGREVVLGYVP